MATGDFGLNVPLQSVPCEHLAQSYNRYYPHTVKGEFTERIAVAGVGIMAARTAVAALVDGFDAVFEGVHPLVDAGVGEIG